VQRGNYLTSEERMRRKWNEWAKSGGNGSAAGSHSTPSYGELVSSFETVCGAAQQELDVKELVGGAGSAAGCCCCCCCCWLLLAAAAAGCCCCWLLLLAAAAGCCCCCCWLLLPRCCCCWAVMAARAVARPLCPQRRPRCTSPPAPAHLPCPHCLALPHPQPPPHQVKDESILKEAISISKSSVVSWVEQQEALLAKEKQFVFRVTPQTADAH
jgi:hypothetical protein